MGNRDNLFRENFILQENLFMKRFLFSIVTIMFCQLFSAQDDFKLAFETEIGTQYYIKELGNYKAWVKSEQKTKTVKSKKTGKYIKSGGDVLIEYWDCNCSDNKYSIESTAKYNRKGELLYKYDADVYRERAIPGTVAEGIIEIVCGHREYLEDERQKELENDPLVKELRIDAERVSSYLDGYRKGYKKSYCAPYDNCIKVFDDPEYFEIGESPEEDYNKGFADGEVMGLVDKNKK